LSLFPNAISPQRTRNCTQRHRPHPHLRVKTQKIEQLREQPKIGRHAARPHGGPDHAALRLV